MLSVLSVQQLSKPKALTAALAPRVCGTVLLPVALHPAEEGLKQQLHLLRWLRLRRRLSLTTTYCPNAATWSSTRSTTMAMIKEKMVRRTGGWRRSVGDPCGHSPGRGGDWGMHGSIAVQFGMRYMSAKGRRDHRSNSRSNSGTVISGPCSGGRRDHFWVLLLSLGGQGCSWVPLGHDQCKKWGRYVSVKGAVNCRKVTSRSNFDLQMDTRHHAGSGGGVNTVPVPTDRQSVTWTAPLPPPVNTRYSTCCTVLARRDPPDFGDFRKRDRMRSIL